MSDVLIPMWTLGDRLAKARDMAGITVGAMVAHLGVSRNTVTNYESSLVRFRRGGRTTGARAKAPAVA